MIKVSAKRRGVIISRCLSSVPGTSPTQPALLSLDRRLKVLSSAYSLPIFLNMKSWMKLFLFHGDAAAGPLRLRTVEGGFIGVASGRQVTAFSLPSVVAFHS